MAADLDQIVEQLSGLTVIEAAQLSKKLEEKWGVSAAAPVAVAAAPAGGAGLRSARRRPWPARRASAAPLAPVPKPLAPARFP